MPRHLQGLDGGHELGGAIAPSSLLEHCQRLAGIEIEIRGVVPDNATLVNERREDGKILLFERGEMMAIDARRLLGFPEGHALGNPGLPQRIPEDAHRDNPAPLSPAHECPRTLDPLPPSYRIPGHLDNQKDRTGYCQASIAARDSCYERRVCRSTFALDDRGAASLVRETTHPRQRARHHRPAATSLQSPTGTAPGRPRGPVGGA